MPLKHNTGTIQMIMEMGLNTMIPTMRPLLEATQAGIRLGQIAVMSLMEILMEKTILFPI